MMSTSTFTRTTKAAARTTMPTMMGRSCWLIAWTAVQPRPGKPKNVSMMMTPPSAVPMSSPAWVTTGVGEGEPGEDEVLEPPGRARREGHLPVEREECGDRAELVGEYPDQRQAEDEGGHRVEEQRGRGKAPVQKGSGLDRRDHPAEYPVANPQHRGAQDQRHGGRRGLGDHRDDRLALVVVIA